MARDMFDTGQKVTFLEWVFAYLVLCIPVVNVIIINDKKSCQIKTKGDWKLP